VYEQVTYFEVRTYIVTIIDSFQIAVVQFFCCSVVKWSVIVCWIYKQRVCLSV